MFIRTIIASAAVFFAVESQAQTFSTGFGDNPGDPTYNAFDGPDVADLAGQNGWQINDATRRLSFIATRANSQAGGLGAVYDEPAGDTVMVRQNVSLPLSMTTFSADFTLSPFTDFEGQDIFGFSLLDGSASPLFSISFEPQLVQDNTLDVRSSILNASSNSSGLGVLFMGDYSLNVSFSPSGSDDVSFVATLTGTDSQSFGGIIPGAGTASVGSFGVFLQVVDNSDSFITFDNVAVVPEPTSLMLLVMGLTGTVLRRRRKPVNI